eukprot:jgi/Tetstr1/447199/TSEL_034636.t1
MGCESCEFPAGPENAPAPKMPEFPIWKMEDGRVFTDYLHRVAYHEPTMGSFYLKEDMKGQGEKLRAAFFEQAASRAQVARCQPPPVPPQTDVQTCDSRVCTFAKVDDAFSLGLSTAFTKGGV